MSVCHDALRKYRILICDFAPKLNSHPVKST